MPTTVADQGYTDAVGSMAVFDRSDRVRIEVTGPDRAKVLHNLTTNDIKRLEPGRGREAFVTSGQGKTLAYVTIHADGDRLLISADPGSADAILSHAGKYGLFDDATFVDISSTTGEYHVVGPETEARLAAIGRDLPSADLTNARGAVAGRPVLKIRERPTGRAGVTMIFAAEDLPTIRDELGSPLIGSDAYNALRIEAGTPVFGLDVTPANLPQEVGRDARSISFVKGCYLGQETVARLDALGHVNKLLVGAVSDDDRVPPPGSVIEVDGKVVGTVTSSALSHGWGRGVVLGYVKVIHAEPGTALVAVGPLGPIGLTVHRLPMLPT